ncbi:MAG: hypothetical protein V3W11_09730 [bacterium]
MRRLITAATLCGALIFVTGCISYEQHTAFESDGSGRIVLDAWVDYFAGDEEEDQEAEENAQPEISEELGPAFADLEGVMIEENWTELEGEGEERREHTHLVLSFDKVERLNGHGAFKNQKLTFQKNGDEFSFKQVIHNDRKEEQEESTEESEELARTLFEGYTFTYTVVMPGRVVNTGGTVGDDGRTVTWEWPLFEFANEEEIIMTAKSQKE